MLISDYTDANNNVLIYDTSNEKDNLFSWQTTVKHSLTHSDEIKRTDSF